MLEISTSAATFISEACATHDLGDGSGMRIFADDEPKGERNLRLRYVAGPDPSDVVVDGGDARVFLAEEVASIVAPLVLDTRNDDGDARKKLVLRKGT